MEIDFHISVKYESPLFLKIENAFLADKEVIISIFGQDIPLIVTGRAISCPGKWMMVDYTMIRTIA